MTPISFPYPEYSWSLAQHFGRLNNPLILFKLLEAASIFATQPNAASLISQMMSEPGLLPPNKRQDAGGRSQIWRDYQQVLAELGLIVSTQFTAGKIQITPIGLMWLDGQIGFSELMATQCFRYQYPNGYKHDIPDVVREAFARDNKQLPSTRTELDTIYDVRIKPGILILRILLELVKMGAPPELRVDECLVALVPIRTNEDWHLAKNTLISVRRDGLPSLDPRKKRHVAEWFRFLDSSGIFSFQNSRKIILTNLALRLLDQLEALCAYHEDPENFWLSGTQNKHDAGLSWFDFFGTPELASQWLLPESELGDEIVSENYPSGREEPGDLEQEGLSDLFAIKLREFAPFDGNILQDINLQLSSVDAQNIIAGRHRQRRSSRLHEQIVTDIATKLAALGYSVREDPQSVDLLASAGESETVIEVKTVTRHNVLPRMRLGVGQLSEYRYRREIQTNRRPSGILVLSSRSSFPDWLISYFEADIQLGLMSLSSQCRFAAHTSGELEKLLQY